MGGSSRKKGRTLFILAVMLVLAGLVIPGTSAAVPADALRVNPFVTISDLTVTNNSLANHTLPSEYQATPPLLKVQVELPCPPRKGRWLPVPGQLVF